jgi:hypothetical protein
MLLICTIIWIKISNIIHYECTFHEYLPDDDPAGSKHVANCTNKHVVIFYLFIANLLCTIKLCMFRSKWRGMLVT